MLVDENRRFMSSVVGLWIKFVLLQSLFLFVKLVSFKEEGSMHGIDLILFVETYRLIRCALLNRIGNTHLEFLLLHGTVQGCVSHVEREGQSAVSYNLC